MSSDVKLCVWFRGVGGEMRSIDVVDCERVRFEAIMVTIKWSR